MDKDKDKDKQEKEKRDAPNVPESKKDHLSFFARLHTLLQTHGYPVKGDREKKTERTSVISQKEKDKVNPEISGQISNWVPSSSDYEDLSHKILQSLDGFMIIMSTDGVIIFVAENIFTVLGHLPENIMGKKLLSLLPDQEKKEVFQKICLKFPVSTIVGKDIEFCCHLRRGNVECGDGGSPAYEQAKFILSIKDISDEPLSVLSRFFPGPEYFKSSKEEIPLEDRFYMVGTVCVLRVQTLRKILFGKETSGDIEILQSSNEENSSTPMNVEGQRISARMESLPAASTDTASHIRDRIDIADAERGKPQESTPVINVESDISDTSRYSTEISHLSAPSSLWGSDLEPELEEMGEMEGVEQAEQQMDVTEQPLQVPSPIAVYINKREEELMKKFGKQLDEKTKMLHMDIRKQRNSLEVIKEQLKRMQDSKFQIRDQFSMQPTMTQRTYSYSPRSLEPSPKKQRTNKMERSFSDPSETRSFSASYSSHSFKSVKDFKDSFKASPQAQSTDSSGEKSLGSQEEDSQSSVPKDLQEESPLSFAQNPSTEMTSASSTEPLTVSDLDLESFDLETPEDYIHLWQQPSDTQNRVSLQVKAWPCSAQDETTIFQQVPAPQAKAQGPKGPQASKNPAQCLPGQTSSFLLAKKSERDGQLNPQYPHSKF